MKPQARFSRFEDEISFKVFSVFSKSKHHEKLHCTFVTVKISKVFFVTGRATTTQQYDNSYHVSRQNDAGSRRVVLRKSLSCKNLLKGPCLVVHITHNQWSQVKYCLFAEVHRKMEQISQATYQNSTSNPCTPWRRFLLLVLLQV